MSGNREALSYIRELHRAQGPKVPALRTKVMLVGQGRVGKTSLLNTMIRSLKYNTDQALPSDVADQEIKLLDEKMTEGVDMREFDLPALLPPDENNKTSTAVLSVTQYANVKERLTVSWWDFAGQEVFYAAHSLFLSVNCVYLVVFKPDAKSFDKDRYRMWLNEIRSRLAGNKERSTPVFVVATHKDCVELPQDHDEVFKDFIALAKEYPMLLKKSRFFHVSNNQEFNEHDKYSTIGKLRTAIIEAAMMVPGVCRDTGSRRLGCYSNCKSRTPSVTDTRPVGWNSIKKHVVKPKRPRTSTTTWRSRATAIHRQSCSSRHGAMSTFRQPANIQRAKNTTAQKQRDFAVPLTNSSARQIMFSQCRARRRVVNLKSLVGRRPL
eukprot:TRINITY_DN68149_c0_g1_i6.p1 TRINITY_DN68149_c0_g1~~TRINITY_DN68149_c0_g1_i6.p1  ORF type:complete len:438 (-),score=138.17 TRINITY_DN68149_c0_g1_i6:155-1294(-)